MAESLPTLAEIDAELRRSIDCRDRALAEIASLFDDVSALDVLVDEMLEHRSRIAALSSCA